MLVRGEKLLAQLDSQAGVIAEEELKKRGV
jgi:hypothetical protein